MDKAKKSLADASAARGTSIEPKLADSLVEQVTSNPGAVAGSIVLWVDDHHENNTHERETFRTLGIWVDLAWTTEEAISLLGRTQYDAIISDLVRGRNFHAGQDLLHYSAHESGLIATPPVLFYTSPKTAERAQAGSVPMLTRSPGELLAKLVEVLLSRKGALARPTPTLASARRMPT